MLPPALLPASTFAPRLDVPLLAITWLGGGLLLACLVLLIRAPRLDPAFRAAVGRWLLWIGAGTLLLFQLLAAREAMELDRLLTALGSRGRIRDWGGGVVCIARASLFGWLLLLLTLGGAWLAGAVGRTLRPATGLMLFVLPVLLCHLLVIERSDAVGAAFAVRWGDLATPAPPPAPNYWAGWIPEEALVRGFGPAPTTPGNLLGLLPLFRVLLLPAAMAAVLGILELLRVARGREPRWGAPWTGTRLLLQAAALGVAVVHLELLAMERAAVFHRWGTRAPSLSFLLVDFRAEAWPALAVAGISLGCFAIGTRERWLLRGKPGPGPRGRGDGERPRVP